MSHAPKSIVFVLDHDDLCASEFDTFCETNDLIAIRVSPSRLGKALASKVELGAILLSERFAGSLEDTALAAEEIRAKRPEIPIILRRDSLMDLRGLPPLLERCCCAAYVSGAWDGLRKVFDEYVFSLVYPNELVRGIIEISNAAIASQFRSVRVLHSAPYIVRDRVIFGEIFTLIPLESAWCRGYMMMQVEESALLRALTHERGSQATTFRDVNNILGELTNLIWGAFKNRFIGDTPAVPSAHIQVPLVVNHHHRYISFGTENPQLLMLYHLLDLEGRYSIKLYQRFVFNLHWSPEALRETALDPAAAIASGELDLF